MQTNSKIPLYKERTFGEKFSVTFAFLRQNWKLWLQLSCYLLLPLCLVQALALNAMAGGIIEGGMLSESVGDIMPSELQDGAGYLVSYLALILFNYVGVSILVAMLYSMMRYDRDHAGGLSGVAFADLKQMFFKGLRRALLLLFALSLLTILYFVIILLLGYDNVRSYRTRVHPGMAHLGRYIPVAPCRWYTCRFRTGFHHHAVVYSYDCQDGLCDK